jgi:hypothetical protein
MTTDSFSGKSEGKEHLTNAVMGLIFLIGGYLIFLQINPNILNIDFSSASGMVKVDAKDIYLGLDPLDANNYEKLRAAHVAAGLDGEKCANPFGAVTDSGILENCNELRESEEFRNKNPTACERKRYSGGVLPK